MTEKIKILGIDDLNHDVKGFLYYGNHKGLIEWTNDLYGTFSNPFVHNTNSTDTPNIKIGYT